MGLGVQSLGFNQLAVELSSKVLENHSGGISITEWWVEVWSGLLSRAVYTSYFPDPSSLQLQGRGGGKAGPGVHFGSPQNTYIISLY
jgi:hypothetical protein